MSTPERAGAGWYPDPWHRFEYRFFNGTGWTADVSNRGERYVDVLGVTTTAPPNVPIWPVAGPARDGLATAAMVLGIIGLFIAWMPFVFVVGAILAVLAVIFGVVALHRRRPAGRGFAIAGLATGGAGIALAAVGLAFTVWVTNAIDDFDSPPPADVDITACTVDGRLLTVSGTIENLGDRSADYRIVMRVRGDATTSSQRVVVEVDEVPAGARRTFGDTFLVDGGVGEAVGDPSCRVVDVTGPTPFGLDLDG